MRSEAMIGDSRESINASESKAKIAFRDAIIVFLLILVTKLMEAGFPPTIEALYYAFLGAILMGIISYMYSLGIKRPVH